MMNYLHDIRPFRVICAVLFTVVLCVMSTTAKAESDEEIVFVDQQANLPTTSVDDIHPTSVVDDKHQALPSSLDETLDVAYRALVRDHHDFAARAYQKVLQQDRRNLDAMLGMLVLAHKKNDVSDIQHWGEMILRLNPHETTARLAILNIQSDSGDVISKQNKIKNLLLIAPENAYLHANLADSYAEKNDWSLAQEAYFNASKLAPNHPAYALNLAISLDHLGKPALALDQYKRSLHLAENLGIVWDEKELILSRIKALTSIKVQAQQR